MRGDATDAEVWETLVVRGWIPDEWVSDPQRRYGNWCTFCGALGFRLESGVPETCAICEGATFERSPAPGRPLAIALASDVAGVRAAEALAREFLERLRPLGVSAGSEVSWRYGSRSMQVALRQWRYLGATVRWPFAGYARQSFEVAVQVDERAARESAWEPDPFDPLFRLYELGYAVDTVLRGGVVLAAP